MGIKTTLTKIATNIFRFNLEKTFLRDCKNVSREADIIGVIHDVTNIWTREKLDIKAINLLKLQEEKPSFLVLNKVYKVIIFVF